MSTKRLAGLGLMFASACLLNAIGCSSSSSGDGAPIDGGSVSATTGAGGAGSSTTSTTTGTGGTGVGDGAAPSALPGAPCKSTADCKAGLTCLSNADDLAAGESSPNGICTYDCTSAACPTGSLCVTFENNPTPTSKAYCMEACTPGVAASPMNMKCHLRPDYVCTPLTTPGNNACLPLCTDDADCGTRKCDPLSGHCMATVGTGKPLGEDCMTDTECAGGFCLPFMANAAPGTCSSFCRFGNTNAGCGFRLTGIDAGPPIGACLYTSMSGQSGDLGACGTLCDVASDCHGTSPGYTCQQDSTIKRIFGHGYCGFAAVDGGPKL